MGFPNEDPSQAFGTANGETLCCHVRWMLNCDVEQVRSIVEHTLKFPPSEAYLRGIIQTPRSRKSGQRVSSGELEPNAMIAEYQNQVIGVITYTVGRGFADIEHVAVHSGCQRRDVGPQLLERVFAQARPVPGDEPDVRIFVRDGNEGAQHFFKKFDHNGQKFRATTPLVPGHFPRDGELVRSADAGTGREDAILFQYGERSDQRDVLPEAEEPDQDEDERDDDRGGDDHHGNDQDDGGGSAVSWQPTGWRETALRYSNAI